MRILTRFREAFSIYRRHFGLLALIVLAVWVPGNTAVDLVERHLDSLDDYMAMAAASLIGGILSPLCTAALIQALGRIRRGERAGWRDAMKVGLQKWGTLFFAQFVASLLVLAGLVALVVPGVYLMICYSLLAPVVVLEKRGRYRPRARSALLTLGLRWQIVGSGLLFLAGSLLLEGLLYLPMERIPSLDILPLRVAADCALDLVYTVLEIVLFLFYWQAVHGDAEGRV